MADDDECHRTDYLVVEFPGGTMRAAGLALLADMIDGAVGRVLDLVFIHKDAEDCLSVIDVSQLVPDVRFDLATLKGAATGRLDRLDIAAAGAHIDTGSSAGIIGITMSEPLASQEATVLIGPSLS